MAVAYAGSSESHTGTTGSTSQASFSWTHTPSGTPRSAVVFVFTIAGSALDTEVTYGGAAMSAVPYSGFDTDTEPGGCRAYFLDGVPSGAQTVVVSRTNSATTLYAACYTLSAAGPTEVHLPGVVTEGGSSQTTAASTSGTGTGAAGVVSVDDGSPGTSSLRLQGRYYGGSSVLAAGSGSTAGPSIDLGLYVVGTYYESSAGQGARGVGSASGTDDRGSVSLAVREVPPAVALPAAASAVASGAAPSVTAGGGTSSYHDEVAADSPAAYWRLGESAGTAAADSSGNGHDGTYVGSPALGSAGLLAGDPDTAVGLVPSQRVDAAGASVSASAYTLEGWLRGTSFSDLGFISQWNATGSLGVILYISGTTVYAYHNGSAVLAWNSSGSPSGAVNDGSAHHVVQSYDGSQARIYYDGALAAGPTSVAAPTQSGTFRIGNYGAPSGTYNTFTADEAAVYPTALSAARVAAHYSAGTSSGSGATSLPGSAAASAAGAAPSVAAPRIAQPGAATTTLSGPAPTVLSPRLVQPAAATAAAAGSAPAVLAPRVAQPAGASASASGSAPQVAVPSAVQPSPASAAASGAVPAVGATSGLTALPAAASAVASGAAPAVAASDNRLAAPTAAAATAAGQALQVLSPRLAVPAGAGASAAGAVPAVSAGASLTALPGGASASASGTRPDVSAPRYALVGPASASASGSAPAVLLPVRTTPTGAVLSLVPAALGVAYGGALPARVTASVSATGSLGASVSQTGHRAAEPSETGAQAGGVHQTGRVSAEVAA